MFTYTLILKSHSLSNSVSSSETLGVRIPDHQIASIASELQLPIITTSVNSSGELPISSILQIPEEIKRHINFAINQGTIEGKPSTIVNLTKDPVEIIERR